MNYPYQTTPKIPLLITGRKFGRLGTRSRISNILIE
jgi:hypothetical protein